jgi:hypothetical protein
MVSPSVAADENWKVAVGRFCSPGSHLSTFNNYWDASSFVDQRINQRSFQIGSFKNRYDKCSRVERSKDLDNLVVEIEFQLMIRAKFPVILSIHRLDGDLSNVQIGQQRNRNRL